MLSFFKIKNYRKVRKSKKSRLALTKTPPVTRAAATNWKKRVSDSAFYSAGSITVEAALVVPLFLSALIAILFLIQVIQVQVHIQKALYNQTLTAAGYAYFVDQTGMEEQVSRFLEAAAVKAMVVQELGADYLDRTPIINGHNGLFLDLITETSTNMLSITLRYQMQPPFNLFRLGSLSFVSKASCRIWVGSTDNSADSLDADIPIVYITPNGTVFHVDRNCTYLQPQTFQCSYAEISSLRNAGGAKYYPCENCVEDTSVLSTVYYTKYGTRYHASAACSNLHHNIISMELERAQEKYAPCSKCAAANNSKSASQD